MQVTSLHRFCGGSLDLNLSVHIPTISKDTMEKATKFAEQLASTHGHDSIHLSYSRLLRTWSCDHSSLQES